jgi:hypothetical protein
MDVHTKGKLRLYSKAPRAFVLLSKLQIEMIKDQLWISRNNRCPDRKQTLVVLKSASSFCSSFQITNRDNQGSTVDQ